MNPDTRHDRWLHVLPLVVIAALAIAFWQPAAETAPSPEEEAKIADLATRLGTPASTAADYDSRLRSFGLFPPDAKASFGLAEALIRCGVSGFPEPLRYAVARHLYAVTVIGDSRSKTVPAALAGIQQTATAAGCNGVAVDDLVRAARATARTDPNPRRDWW